LAPSRELQTCAMKKAQTQTRGAWGGSRIQRETAEHTERELENLRFQPPLGCRCRFPAGWRRRRRSAPCRCNTVLLLAVPPPRKWAESAARSTASASAP